MSELPIMFSNFWEEPGYPHHVPSQHFAMGFPHDRLHQEFPSTPIGSFYNYATRRFGNHYHPRLNQGLNQSERGLSVLKSDKDKFQVALDVQLFSPNELKVKVVDDYVVVEGKHDEKVDEHGSVMRQFIRKYLIPQQCDIDKVSSSLSSDGVLTLNAPRKIQTENAQREKIVNIQRTGKSAGSSGVDEEISEVEKGQQKDARENKPRNEPVANCDNAK